MRRRLSLLLLWLLPLGASAAGTSDARCPEQEAGLSLPPGFCARVFADGLGHARHLIAAANGVLYVNTWSGRYYANQPPPAGGFLLALRDSKGSGRADVIERFGPTAAAGGRGGTGIGIFDGALYAEANDEIVRYALSERAGAATIAPAGAAVAVVTGLPQGGDHPMHPFAIDAAGQLYIDVASATNACQYKNRSPGSRGIDPCTELLTRGGVWRYDARREHQKFSPAERFATGIRNAEGFAIDAAGQRIFATQHGRDQLHANWPALYRPEEEATLPAEELLLLEQGADYGWPECYYDPVRSALVLAPEYGGNGGELRGGCAQKRAPLAAFPAHWAPNAMLLYEGSNFPARYHRGVFIAFHGSWDRGPYEQQGYNVVFQSLEAEHAGALCEIFADGFAGAVKSPEGALHRPSGLALAPDGALYVSDDVHGRIYRIEYRGGDAGAGSGWLRPCPSAAGTAGALASASGTPPEGTHADAGAASAGLRAPAGVSAAAMELGSRVFRGAAGGATCTSCHGAQGGGTPLGPDLTDATWLWSDGSPQGIAATITRGVAQPKKYRAPMPPMGGAELTREEVSAVAAYVWGLSHPGR